LSIKIDMKKALLLCLACCMVESAMAQIDTLGKSPFFFFGAPIESDDFYDSVNCNKEGLHAYFPPHGHIYHYECSEYAILMHAEDTIHITGIALGLHGGQNPFDLSLYDYDGMHQEDPVPMISTTVPAHAFSYSMPIDSFYLQFLAVPGWSNLVDICEWADPRYVYLSFFEGGTSVDIIGDFYIGIPLQYYGQHGASSLLYISENHEPPYHFPARPLRYKRDKVWEDDTINDAFPMLFPIVEPRCEAVEEVRVTTDSAGCLVAEWDSLPRQEQWVVALNIEGQTATVLDTVNACHWQYCALPAGTPYQIGVRSRCTNLRSYSWSKWNAPIDVSIKAVVPEETFVVAPNPTTGVVRLQLPPSAAHDSRAEVYSADGRHMATYRLPMLSTTATLDLSALPSGLYLLRLTTPQGMYSQKVLLR